MRRLLLPVAAVACLLAGQWLPAQTGNQLTINPLPDTPPDRGRLTSVVGAGLEGGLMLDEYMLASGKRHPIAIVVHGGGYVSGSKRGDNEFALTDALLDGNFSVFTVAYHLAPEAGQELMVREIQRTVRFARSHADRLNLDPSRIVLVGEEVGGLLAAAAALAPPSTEPRSHFEYDRESDAVQAVVAIGCAGDFGKNAPRPRSNVGPEITDLGIFKGYFPKYFTTSKDVPIRPLDGSAAPAAAPDAPPKFRPDAPPFLVIQGSSHNDIGCAESTTLYNALQSSGDQAKLVTVGPDRLTEWKFQAYRKPLWQKDMMAWLKTTIASAPHAPLERR